VPDTFEPFDLSHALPFDRDANDQQPAVLGVAPEHFLYLGQGLTAAQFAAYVLTYDFGRIPPDSIVLHHTAVPSMLAARYPSGAVWDAGETNLNASQIVAKRKRQLDQLRNYYRDTLLWDRGIAHTHMQNPGLLYTFQRKTPYRLPLAVAMGTLERRKRIC
jgi:hypothetical protein